MADYVIALWIGGLYRSTAPPARSATTGSTANLVAAQAESAGNEAVILAAAEHLLEDTPLGDLSVLQICERAGVGRTTFYRHFGSKLDVVAKLLERALADAYNAFDNLGVSPERHLHDTLAPRLHAMSFVWTRHRAVLRAAAEGWHQIAALQEIWLGIIRPIWRGHRRNGRSRTRTRSCATGPDDWHFSTKMLPSWTSAEEAQSIIDRVSPEMVRKSYFVGTPEDVAAQLQPFLEAGTTWVGITDYMPITLPLEAGQQAIERSIELLGLVKQRAGAQLVAPGS